MVESEYPEVVVLGQKEVTGTGNVLGLILGGYRKHLHGNPSNS